MTQPTELDELTERERALLRHAVEDHGPGIWHSPLTGGSRDAVGRYLAEGGKLLPEHDWQLVWRCVVQLLDREPDLVTGQPPTHSELADRRAERALQADALLVEALHAFRANRWDAALTLVDRAELAAPSHHPKGRTYDDIRSFVRRSAERAT